VVLQDVIRFLQAGSTRSTLRSVITDYLPLVGLVTQSNEHFLSNLKLFKNNEENYIDNENQWVFERKLRVPFITFRR